MLLMKETVPFDWSRIWLGEEAPLTFLGEVLFRSVLMYLLILLTLRIMGKRGIKQLSLFEFSIILALGSAAGDPMFYEDVPIMHAVAVFAVILALYVLFNYWTEQSERVETWLEGKATCILEDGEINLSAFKSQKLTYREFFGEMRQYQVEHLGQVRKVYLESTGEISLYFFEESAIKAGLPIFPEVLAQARQEISLIGWYACKSCGHVQELQPTPKHACSKCQQELWLEACRTKRIT
ncbi:DUF421 domain-containing protein [Adhaeribacter arboris]|uniref:DUF421 domain-containing protein n=2 Tax=Adhaeribacter arboris TaxID=2072846 RepID=A0A2T2YKB0_9BACT|nr:DUF421 domain-containing protein [Adhaeribacter arboris]